MARARTTLVTLVVGAALTAGLAGCRDSGSEGAGGSSAPPTPVVSPSSAEPTPTTAAPSATVPARVSVAGTVASDLEVPWGVTFLPDGAALVAERDTARLLRVGPDGAVARLGVVPGVRHGGEGGLLGLAVS
ncbi:MAG: PQQ-dependent sugar dehydrogenase, partial [Actinomycetia bacterium]|nr:PQQ-dependent sugar dehydrogenase [Actinomycetes bacterium]